MLAHLVPVVLFPGKQTRNRYYHPFRSLERLVYAWYRHSPPGGDSAGSTSTLQYPSLRCSEHAIAKHAKQSAQLRKRSSQRGRHIRSEQEGDVFADGMVPGTHVPRQLLSDMPHQCHMSDMTHLITLQKVPGTVSLNEIRSEVHVPGMLFVHHSSLCICSHVGYTKLSRLATCPGQCAHPKLGRFETCPGQCAHSSNSRSETCPGQSAHTSRPETCPGQCALESRSRTKTCSEQLYSRDTCSEQLTSTKRFNCSGQQDQMAESRERTASLNDELPELKFLDVFNRLQKSPRLST